MKKALLLLICTLLCFALPSNAAEKYWIKVSPKVEGAYKITANATTNLPDGVIIYANGYYAGLGDEDPAIGFNGGNVAVKGGKAVFVIEADKTAEPSKELIIKGEYELHVCFSPFWDENQAAAQKLSITNSIETIQKLHLVGNGKDKKAIDIYIKRQKSKDWVMQEVYPGTRWDTKLFTKKLGLYKTYDPKNLNPKVVKMFYFSDVDMTLIVNVRKGEIMAWRDGKATE